MLNINNQNNNKLQPQNLNQNQILEVFQDIMNKGLSTIIQDSNISNNNDNNYNTIKGLNSNVDMSKPITQDIEEHKKDDEDNDSDKPFARRSSSNEDKNLDLDKESDIMAKKVKKEANSVINTEPVVNNTPNESTDNQVVDPNMNVDNDVTPQNQVNQVSDTPSQIDLKATSDVLNEDLLKQICQNYNISYVAPDGNVDSIDLTPVDNNSQVNTTNQNNQNQNTQQSTPINDANDLAPNTIEQEIIKEDELDNSVSDNAPIVDSTPISNPVVNNTSINNTSNDIINMSNKTTLDDLSKLIELLKKNDINNISGLRPMLLAEVKKRANSLQEKEIAKKIEQELSALGSNNIQDKKQSKQIYDKYKDVDNRYQSDEAIISEAERIKKERLKKENDKEFERLHKKLVEAQTPAEQSYRRRQIQYFERWCEKSNKEITLLLKQHLENEKKESAKWSRESKRFMETEVGKKLLDSGDKLKQEKENSMRKLYKEDDFNMADEFDSEGYDIDPNVDPEKDPKNAWIVELLKATSENRLPSWMSKLLDEDKAKLLAKGEKELTNLKEKGFRLNRFSESQKAYFGYLYAKKDKAMKLEKDFSRVKRLMESNKKSNSTESFSEFRKRKLQERESTKNTIRQENNSINTRLEDEKAKSIMKVRNMFDSIKNSNDVSNTSRVSSLQKESENVKVNNIPTLSELVGFRYGKF